MNHDIIKFLSYEIRKEIADRYFGFRKLIEEDTQALDAHIRLYSATVEQRICFDLVRIYILLKDEELINLFISLAGLHEKIFYDPYLVESPTIRQRVFAGIKLRGFTKGRRFVNLMADSYASLVDHVEKYRGKFGELVEDRDMIEEEIKMFYKKHDLNNIMDFLRAMDSSSDYSSLQTSTGVTASNNLDEKLRLKPPPPIEYTMPVIPPLKPLVQVRKPLKKLAQQAYKYHKKAFTIR